jgi:AcrR family transcriptional regulator
MGDTRRRQILEGLLRAVAKHGLRECNMSRVADEAGLSRGILHYYFADKEEMLGALVQHLREENFRHFATSVGRLKGPWERLRSVLRYPARRFGRERGAMLAKVWVEFWGLSSENERVREFVLRLQSDLRSLLRLLIQDGQDQGVFRRDVPAKHLATILMGALEGMVLQWRFAPREAPFAATARSLERMLERVLRG